MEPADLAGGSLPATSEDRLLESLGRLGSRRRATRRLAAEEVLDLVGRHPDAAADNVAAIVSNLRADVEFARSRSLRALAELARHRPRAVLDHLGAVRAVLADPEDEARADACAVVAELARTHPEAVATAIPAIHAVLTDPDPAGQIQGLLAVRRVARVDVDAVAPALRRVVRLLESPDEAIRREATACVGTCGPRARGVVALADRRLTDRLTDLPEVRRQAVRAVTRVALAHPEAIRRPESVADALEEGAETVDADPQVARAAARLRAAAGDDGA